MTEELRTSENKLSQLKQSAQKHLRFWGHNRVGYGVDANVLLALIDCALALRSVKDIAFEAHREWYEDNDARVGKILLALAGHRKKYRSDIDRIHAAIAKLEAM